MSVLLSDIIAAIETAKESSEVSISDFTALSEQATHHLEQLNNDFDSKILPAMKSAINTVKNEAEHAGEILQAAVADLPAVNKVLVDAASGLKIALNEAEIVRNRLPAAESKLKNVTSRISEFEKEASLQDLIDLLTIDFAKESDFFAEPVKLVENVLYPIPNYGSAMSPFFTTLSLWVGGILLVSLLSVEVHGLAEGTRSYHEYFGRYLTFLTIALLQSLIVTIGDLLLLKAYAANPVHFVLFGLFNSGVFMLMIYTFVSVFGNVGKAMAVVLLVLQLAGSGGTFPIQVTPPFFQAIYPYLPFTYSISLMREAVGGSVSDIVIRDFTVLLIYSGITIILGVGLKGFVNKIAAKSVKKAKSGHLIH
ncbi:ABC-2 family transporter protein [compost metagenome]